MHVKQSLRSAFLCLSGFVFRLWFTCDGLALVDPRVHLSLTGRNTQIHLGDRVLLYHDVSFFLDADNALVSIGERTYINRRTEIICKERIQIGRHCAVAWDVCITDSDYHSIDANPGTKPVVIGDHVWIGAHAIILKGVNIGDGAVVAAGAIVTHDVPARTLVAGVPDRVIRQVRDWK